MMSEYLARLPAKLGLGVWGVGRNTRWQGVGTLFARKTAARKTVGKRWGTPVGRRVGSWVTYFGITKSI